MDSDLKHWLIFWGWIALMAVALSLGSTAMCFSLDRKYIEAGYTREMLPGSSYTKWVKPCEAGDHD